MTSLASPCSILKEAFLASKIRARIAEHVGVDIQCINDNSHLSDDFGLDLLDIIELVIVLEEEFGTEGGNHGRTQSDRISGGSHPPHGTTINRVSQETC